MFRWPYLYWFWPLWPSILSSSAFLAKFKRLHFCYFPPYWPCSGGCIFVIFGLFGHVQAAAFYHFRPFWPCSGGCIFVIFGRFGHVQAAAFLLFSAVLAMFRRLHFYYCWPFWPCSGGCVFISSGHFSHVEAAAFLLLSAVLATEVRRMCVVTACGIRALHTLLSTPHTAFSLTK